MINQSRVYEIIEKGQPEDRASHYCDIFLFALILLNLVAVCLETIDALYIQYKTVFTDSASVALWVNGKGWCETM